uniref:Uncharacterized protein n=1 Tax=Arundo donax TaxID=35708 RepID=A0A0A9A7A1_ARUDO
MVHCCSPDELQLRTLMFLLIRCSSLISHNLLQAFAHEAFDKELLAAGFLMSINCMCTDSLCN